MAENNHIEEALRKELKRRDIEVALYRELGALTSEAVPLGTILDRLMDYVLLAMETDSGTLYLLDEPKKELVFEIVKGPMAEKLRGKRMGMNEGIAGHVMQTGEPHISDMLSKDKMWRGQGAGFEVDRRRASITVPVKLKGKPMGAITVIGKDAEGMGFVKEDAETLLSIANHFSIIMERGELLSSLAKKVAQLETLNVVGALLISTLDEKLVRTRAMGAITKLMDAEAGSLLLVDKKTGDLYFEVALGEKGSEIKTVRLKIGEGVAGWVAKHGTPALIPDAATDERFQARVDKKSQFVTRNMVCVPVKIKADIIGVLQAINKVGGVFTEEDKGLFELFADQVAIALDNARLYQEIRATFYATSGALAEAIEKRDPYTGGHTKRVLEYSLIIGREMGLEKVELENLKLSAVLHDVGKIGVDDAILRKQGRLDDEEQKEMMKHPDFGGDIMKRVPQLSN
ncbi:MAG: GAF domain-containing protein, partial [Thermodesulfobacteriota bacterium]